MVIPFSSSLRHKPVLFLWSLCPGLEERKRQQLEPQLQERRSDPQSQSSVAGKPLGLMLRPKNLREGSEKSASDLTVVLTELNISGPKGSHFRFDYSLGHPDVMSHGTMMTSSDTRASVALVGPCFRQHKPHSCFLS